MSTHLAASTTDSVTVYQIFRDPNHLHANGQHAYAFSQTVNDVLGPQKFL